MKYGTDSDPKRRLLEIRRRVIAQKKTYYIQYIHFVDSFKLNILKESCRTLTVQKSLTTYQD